MQIKSKRWLVLSSDPKGEGIKKTNRKKGRIADDCQGNLLMMFHMDNWKLFFLFPRRIIKTLEQKLLT